MTQKLMRMLLIASLICCLAAPLYAEPVWIDVRSYPEHFLDNIEGDVRISHGDIVQEATKLFPDKDTELHLYCGSGGRAEQAKEALTQAGYTNVSNAGGINDAREERGLIKGEDSSN